jgi:DivIVA domain-containing protein
MGDDENVISSGQAITPETVSSRSFTSAFRGYHPVEVREFLKRVGDELAAGAGREAELRRALDEALNRVAHPDLDETTVTTVLGEHAARLISSARETAASITGEATKRADAILRDADGRVARMRDEAEGLLARRLAEADAATDSVRGAAQAEAQRIVEEAAQRGKEMVAEARGVRERMLADLARRRRGAQLQVEQLRAARDRLLSAYDVVRRTVDEATGELEAAEPEARAAAEAVGRADAAGRSGAGAAPARRLPAPPAPAALASPVEEKPLALVATPVVRPAAAVVAAPVAPALSQRVAEPPPVPPAPPERPPLRPQTVAGAVNRALSPPPPPPPPPEPPVPSEPPTGEVAPVVAAPPPPANGNGHANGNGNGNGHGAEAPEKSVDALFARIRADRVSAAAAPPPAPGPQAPGPPPTLDPVASENALTGRDELLEDVEPGLTRALKRVLQDEQNEVLDRLRRAAGGQGEAVLPDPDEQRNGYREAALPWLQQAARAGARFASPASPGPEAERGVPTLDAQAAALAAELVGPLRERLDRALEADDSAAVGEGLRGVYRQWKVQYVEEAARHSVLTAFSLGAFAATPDGATAQWVVGDDGHCPDCDDNALAGPTAKGRPFPTGQLHPPAHPGCRCLLVPMRA